MLSCRVLHCGLFMRSFLTRYDIDGYFNGIDEYMLCRYINIGEGLSSKSWPNYKLWPKLILIIYNYSIT